MKINKAGRLTGSVVMPGDKSISHRAAMLGSIAYGQTTISNFAESEDCSSTLACLLSLGVPIERSGGDVKIFGRGKHGLTPSAVALDCGNSGTTMRLTSGILAGQPFRSVLTGDGSLQKRPMKRVIGPLSEMGASVTAVDDKAPLTIEGKSPLTAIDHSLAVASAQIKSMILLAGLFADGETTVHEAAASRDHTERMLHAFGADIAISKNELGRTIKISGNSTLNACDVHVPGDISSAAFILAAAAAIPGSDVEIKGLGLNPTRSGILDVLREIGLEITVSDDSNSGGEPAGTVRARYVSPQSESQAKYIIEKEKIPNLIDELPVLAVLGTQLPGGLEVRGAKELRHKETDRISAVCYNLRRMNASVEEFDDGFFVQRSELKGTQVDSFGDHRIAMAFAVAGLIAEGETEITEAECVNISFPSFFEVLKKIGG